MAPVAVPVEPAQAGETLPGSGRIAALILQRPTCLMCLAGRAGVAPAVVTHGLRAIDRTIRVYAEADARCRVCGSSAVGPVYSLRRDRAAVRTAAG